MYIPKYTVRPMDVFFGGVLLGMVESNSEVETWQVDEVDMMFE